MNRFVVNVGYSDYAMSEADAVALLGIASRSMEVMQPRFDGIWFPKREPRPFATMVLLCAVNDTPLPPAAEQSAEAPPAAAPAPIPDDDLTF